MNEKYVHLSSHVTDVIISHVTAMSFAMWLLCHFPCDWRHHLPHGPTREGNVEQPERDTWTNQSATRGQTWVRHVDHSKRDTWTNCSATHGQTWVRHVDHLELDTWTKRRTTHGAVSKSHVIISMSACALPRQQPALAVPRGIPFCDQFCDHLAWS
jgi:hypothetical protein